MAFFTFSDDAQTSYEKMISIVTEAEEYLLRENVVLKQSKEAVDINLEDLAKIRSEVSFVCKRPVLVDWMSESNSMGLSQHENLNAIVQQGPLTPDHVIRTKRLPALINDKIETSIKAYVDDYHAYFQKNKTDDLKCLDPAPRWGVWEGYGTLVFGRNHKERKVLKDIIEHTVQAILSAECLGGWKALPEKDIFDVEYWELEQAKLKKGGSPALHEGKVALVTGAASGIGKACVEHLCDHGAVVTAVDINPEIETLFSDLPVLPVCCDVTDKKAISEAIALTVRKNGGLDIIVSNAGFFPQGKQLKDMDDDVWQKSMDVNLTSHQLLLKQAIPFLQWGIDPSVIIVASKNVPAPGRGAGAYSVAKAGLTQFARIAALELGELGIRINVIHPNQVFDTAIWTDDVLKQRAQAYDLSVEEYKRNNLLNVEITSSDIAHMVLAMAAPLFSKTTGAQVPMDGGNERVV